ncbi:hypothetical protein Q8A73_003346 [Channa argus]|nr:hypothetical protein Q8A73_003346 [Channa argus]
MVTTAKRRLADWRNEATRQCCICFRSSLLRFPQLENSVIWEGGERKQAESKQREGEKRKERGEKDVSTSERSREGGGERTGVAAAADGRHYRTRYMFIVGGLVVAVVNAD